MSSGGQCIGFSITGSLPSNFNMGTAFEALIEFLWSAQAMPFHETAWKMRYFVTRLQRVETCSIVSRMSFSWSSYSPIPP